MNKILVVIGVVVIGLVVWGFMKSDSISGQMAVASGHPEWSPIMFKDGEEIKGAGPALVKMILDELGIKSSFPYTGTWDEVQAKARSGEVDILVAAYKTDERLTYMDYSIPYTTDPVALFVNGGKTIKFNEWSDLIGKKGVGTIGDSYGQEFDTFIKEKLGKNFVVASSSAEAFEMVENEGVDYFVYSLFAGEREIKKREQEQPESILISIVPKYVAEENFYVTISKKSPLVSRMGEINTLIEKYKADGTVDRLIAEYKGR